MSAVPLGQRVLDATPAGQRHPWSFRLYPKRGEWTVYHHPSRATVAITSYEQLGGIISGRRRHAVAMKRARQARQLYRSGFRRERVMALVDISRRTFFRYLSAAWDHVDLWVRGKLVPRTLFRRRRRGKGRYVEGDRTYFLLTRDGEQSVEEPRPRTATRRAGPPDQGKDPPGYRVLPSRLRVPEGYEPPPPWPTEQERRDRLVTVRLVADLRRRGWSDDRILAHYGILTEAYRRAHYGIARLLRRLRRRGWSDARIRDARDGTPFMRAWRDLEPDAPVSRLLTPANEYGFVSQVHG